MADEIKMRKSIDRGQKAERLLADDLLKEAFDGIEEEIQSGFQNSNGDEEVLRNAYYLHRSLESLKEKLRQIVVKGKTARTELERQKNV